MVRIVKKPGHFRSAIAFSSKTSRAKEWNSYKSTMVGWDSNHIDLPKNIEKKSKRRDRQSRVAALESSEPWKQQRLIEDNVASSGGVNFGRNLLPLQVSEAKDNLWASVPWTPRCIHEMPFTAWSWSLKQGMTYAQTDISDIM